MERREGEVGFVLHPGSVEHLRFELSRTLFASAQKTSLAHPCFAMQDAGAACTQAAQQEGFQCFTLTFAPDEWSQIAHAYLPDSPQWPKMPWSIAATVLPRHPPGQVASERSKRNHVI